MNIIVRLLGAFALSLSTCAAMPSFGIAEETPTVPQPETTQKPLTVPPPGTTQKMPIVPPSGTIQKTPIVPPPGTIQKTPIVPPSGTTQKTPIVPPSGTTQKICSFDSVESLLPPPTGEQNASPLSYLAQQGFTQKPDGSWVCYVRDSQKQGVYYTLFKVQQINGKLIASSFLNNGSLLEGQENRSLDLFMTLVENHTKTNQGNRQSIRRYLESFVGLIKQGKIPSSGRGYLFDQPSRGFILYNTVTGGELKGTAITININSPQNLGSSPAS